MARVLHIPVFTDAARYLLRLQRQAAYKIPAGRRRFSGSELRRCTLHHADAFQTLPFFESWYPLYILRLPAAADFKTPVPFFRAAPHGGGSVREMVQEKLTALLSSG